ncbi:DEAD/DEAH box helicase family protein [Clostridium sp.]|uniref:DEAD/DEAH box helicase family protein n=1 Tax=Clostridium sp. TaxID=1506 RepID=UPI003F2C1783
MINLDDLFSIDDEEKFIEPDRIFSSLVKNSDYEYLRDVQTEILNAWFNRRNDKDIVLKMNTGAGKTFVGLLMLQSSLNEGIGPAVYLCPDLQLVEQVMQKSKEYGIKCVTFSNNPNKFPIEFLNSEAILVTVFDKLFNGRSIFNKYDIEIGSIILDDAHSCISKARDKFTLKIKSSSTLYYDIYRIFESSLHQQDIGSAKSIYDGDKNTVMQIPFWSWMDNIESVATILSNVSHHFLEAESKKDDVTKNIYFNWPLLKNNLESCNVFISGDTIEITPHCLPINQFKAFENAKRRIFMSATLLDDSLLIKELDINEKAVKSPLINSKQYNIGERMILIPSLINESLDNTKLSEIINDIDKNIIVLTPSSYSNYTKRWTDMGAKLLSSENISLGIKQLNEGERNRFVLPNRYDGIDLHGNQCRVLIIDGLPLGTTLYEKYLNIARPSSKIVKTILTQKIEQGIGRSTRSSSDYSVVILSGADLETFVSINENKKYLSPQTRKQMEIGVKFTKKLQEINETNAEQALLSIMNASLSRNNSWIKFHNSELQKAKQEDINYIPIELATLERQAYKLYNANRSLEASRIIENAINDLGDKLDNCDKGWFLQLAAFYLYKSDKIEAVKKQIKAHELNINLFKTIEGIKYKKVEKNSGLQPNRVLKNIISYDNGNAIIIYVNELLGKLIFGGDSNMFEGAFMELGIFLGYDCQRPEKSFGRGLPDVLWHMSNNNFLIIEAKNEVYKTRSHIYKSEAEQISNSYNWFSKEYKGKTGCPILIHPSNKKEASAYPNSEVRVMTEKELNKLKQNVTSLSRYISSNFNNPITTELIGKQLNLLNLTPDKFILEYTTNIL